MKQASARGIIPSEYYHTLSTVHKAVRELASFGCFLISIPPYHLKRKITNRTDYYHTLFIRRSVSLAEMCPLSDGQILDWFPW